MFQRMAPRAALNLAVCTCLEGDVVLPRTFFGFLTRVLYQAVYIELCVGLGETLASANEPGTPYRLVVQKAAPYEAGYCDTFLPQKECSAPTNPNKQSVPFQASFVSALSLCGGPLGVCNSVLI